MSARRDAVALPAAPTRLPETFWESIRSPGLTPAAAQIRELVGWLPKKLAVFSYKSEAAFLWVLFLGGTGTGKSTIFNALCGEVLSETGVERPKTFGPILYAHRESLLERGFPFDSMAVKRIEAAAHSPSGEAGASGEIVVVEHGREDLSHLVLVDTPDLDSLEIKNRQAVEDLYLLADLVIFVASEEKYADEVPFEFLERIHREGRPCFILLNKAGGVLTRGEVLEALQSQGMAIREERFFVLPYLPARPSEALADTPAFRAFRSAFFHELARSKAKALLQAERRRGAQELSTEIDRLLALLRQEEDAARQWRDSLELIYRASGQKLLEAQQAHFDAETREYLQREIRKHFSKYDLLGKPRRLIAQTLLTPFRLMGFPVGGPQESHQEALLRIRNKIDLTPIQSAVESFNRSVLEKLSPQDEAAPLYRYLRDPVLPITAEEIRKRVFAEQDQLLAWLERTFEELARGIPKSKEWGIYSTSILWGGVILSLETAIGGGITVLEAVLDSAIAPFVTKGAVELFAYHELQRVARELAQRYQNGLMSILADQRDRYLHCLQSLLTPQETIRMLQLLQ